MDRRLLRGGLAAVAALALGIGGSTLSAFDDFTDVPGNHIGAGILRLDLDAQGSDSTTLSVDGLVPGGTVQQLMWIATNDARSAPAGTLSVTLLDLADTPAACNASRGKALGEIVSDVPGCVVTADAESGTPAQGNLSRVLDVGLSYDPAAADPAACTATTPVELPVTGRGNLRALAAGTGTTVVLSDAAGALVVPPGRAVCVALDVSWPDLNTAPDREHPTDNAAQGDSLSFGLRFDLTQVQP